MVSWNDRQKWGWMGSKSDIVEIDVESKEGG
jgi:hypothetical protein